jgi:predicted nucleotidyltransferase
MMITDIMQGRRISASIIMVMGSTVRRFRISFLIVRLKAYLEALLGCPVDIIRKHQHLNPFLLKEVERDGIEVIAER